MQVQISGAPAQARTSHVPLKNPVNTTARNPTAFSSNVLALSSSSGSDDSALNAVLQLVLSCPLLVDALLLPEFALSKGPAQEQDVHSVAASVKSPEATLTATSTTTAANSKNVATGKGPVGYALQHAARQIHGGYHRDPLSIMFEALYVEVSLAFVSEPASTCARLRWTSCR